ncbi:MAG: tetratricopeptide repeat protein, partial [Burkholderiales bacterium]
MSSASEADARVAHWREAVRAEPETPGAHFHLGVALQGAGRYDEAHGAFREALRLRLRGEAPPEG